MSRQLYRSKHYSVARIASRRAGHPSYYPWAPTTIERRVRRDTLAAMQRDYAPIAASPQQFQRSSITGRGPGSLSRSRRRATIQLLEVRKGRNVGSFKTKKGQWKHGKGGRFVGSK